MRNQRRIRSRMVESFDDYTQVLVFKFDTPDEAGDEEYYFRDNWGHKYETMWEGENKVYVAVDDEGAKIAEEFFGRKPVEAISAGLIK